MSSRVLAAQPSLPSMVLASHATSRSEIPPQVSFATPRPSLVLLFFLNRVFQFRDQPKLYTLKGDLAAQLHLEPIDYRASFRRMVDP